ncbi:MAG: hypothetical protein IIZ66_07070 [Clostridia bacterium]|nr:hypothetical protein [Clostridia bacterium]MCR5690589.1 hypothetical protein [Clostridiales bacterium]
MDFLNIDPSVLAEFPKAVQKLMNILLKAFQTMVNLYISTFVKDAATVDAGL